MTIFGLDVSHHQPYLNYAACRNEGVEFAFLKATEGATFTDDKFVGNLANARNAGLLVAAYHYVKSNASAEGQVARVAAVVPKNVPVIPDVEANSGGVQLTRDVVQGLRNAGFTVPLLYLPRWYWQQIGSPSLAGLPPLWSSRYPDYTVRSLTDAYNKAPASYWSGYGGLGVALLQFTSSARVAGYSPLDANAYQGTRAQLAALLGGGTGTDVSLSDEYFEFVPAGEAAVRRVKAIDALANLYVERFYGSGTAPWTGPSGRALDLRPTATVDALALAQQLAGLLPDVTNSLSDADLARVAKAVNDEADRRDRDGDASTGRAS